MDARTETPVSISWTIDFSLGPHENARLIKEIILIWDVDHQHERLGSSSSTSDDDEENNDEDLEDHKSLAPGEDPYTKSMYSCMKPFRSLIPVLEELSRDSDAGTFYAFVIGLKVLEVWNSRMLGLNYAERRPTRIRGPRRKDRQAGIAWLGSS